MAKRRPPMLMSWISAVVDHAQERDDGDPSTTLIVAVSAVRADFANPDGTSCYPAQSTVAERAGATRRAVIGVDHWLVRRELLTFVRHRARGVKEYQLTIPRCAPSDTPAKGADVHGEAQLRTGSKGSAARQLRASCASTFTQPPTSERSEEVEEVRSGVADAPPGEPTPDAIKIARRIGEQAGVLIDATVLASAVERLLVAHPEWSDNTVVTLVAEKAARAQSNPTRYAIGAIDRLLPSGFTLPPRLRASNALDLIEAKILEVDEWGTEAQREQLHRWGERRGLARIEERALEEHDGAESIDDVIATCDDDEAVVLADELERSLADLLDRLRPEAA